MGSHERASDRGHLFQRPARALPPTTERPMEEHPEAPDECAQAFELLWRHLFCDE